MPTYVPFSTLLDSPASTSLLDSLITPARLAARLGLTQRTLSEKRITGTGPAFIRTGKSVRYRPEAVDRWLISNEHHSTSEEVR
jgi:hypothetical protein